MSKFLLPVSQPFYDARADIELCLGEECSLLEHAAIWTRAFPYSNRPPQ